MIGRFARRVAVRYGAWTLRHGIITLGVMHAEVARSFSHQGEEWRAGLVEDMRQRNRARTMRQVNA